MLKKNLYLMLIVLSHFNYLFSELRVVCSVALLDKGFEERKNEYINCFQVLKRYGINNPYVIEAIKGKGPSFLNQYSKNVFYSAAQDFNLIDPLRNKGVNEVRTMLDGFNYFRFNPEDMVLKITGRYHLKSDRILRMIEENPDVDVFVKVLPIHDGHVALTSCFAMRYKFLKDMFESIDLNEMATSRIPLESKVYDYINKLKQRGVKIMFIDMLDLRARVQGDGNYKEFVQ